MTQKQAINEQVLLRIADSVPALIALYNIQTGEYLYVNQSITRLLGYTPEEVKSGGLEFMASLVHHVDLPKIMQKNQQALEVANQEPRTTNEVVASFEYRMRHKDGSWRWIYTEGTVFGRDEQGKVELLLNVSLDVTERKDAQTKLLASLKALENALALE